MSAQFTYSSRLNSFKARPDLFNWVYGPSDIRDLIRRASLVNGLDSVMLNFPEHFGLDDLLSTREALRSTDLKMCGINLRYPEDPFMDGAFTNPLIEKRREAIQLTCDAADACRELGGKHVIVWLGNDGFDYPFQLNYAQAWEWEIEGIRAVAEYAPDLKVSIEYKPADPRRFSLIGDLGTTLLAIREAGSPPNLGVTLDFCHLLMANENPAMSAAMCGQRNQLYGIHLNDGYGSLDDGLMVGSVNFTRTLELLYYAIRNHYAEIVYFDTFPTRENPVLECEANIQRVNQMVELINRMDPDRMEASFAKQDGLAANQIVWEAMFQR